MTPILSVLFALLAIVALLAGLPRMSSGAPPRMVRRPRRLAAPSSLGGRPLLEQQHQYLYSAIGLDNAALPSELTFFTYARGQNVPGAGNFAGVVSNLFHTNMEAVGALPQPKVFTIQGLRLFLPNIASTAGAAAPELTDPSFGAASQDSEILEDLLTIANSCTLRVTVGPKDYANHPAFMFPANTGFAGLAAVGQDNGTAATIGQLDNVAPHMTGQYWNLPTYPVVIASQQNFRAQLITQWATNPSMNDDRILFCFFDGILSREVS